MLEADSLSQEELKSKYTIAVQWSDENDCYISGFPEFPGQAWRSHGNTYEEAKENGEKVLESLIEDYETNGERLPEFHEITEVFLANFDNSCSYDALFDHERIGLFSSGWVYVNHVAYCPEYWYGLFCKEEEIDPLDPVHGEIVNSACWDCWYPDLESFFEWHQPFCKIPEKRWRFIVPRIEMEWMPRAAMLGCQVMENTTDFHCREKDFLNTLNSPEGYKFWFRAFCCHCLDGLMDENYLFDVFYPLQVKRFKDITVIVAEKNRTEHQVEWCHGDRGLVKKIIKEFEYLTK